MSSRVGLVLLGLAVAYASRNVVHQVRVLADPSRPRELDARVSDALATLSTEVPEDSVVRFPQGASRHSLMAQLRYELAPRRVRLEGEADFVVVPTTEVGGRSNGTVVGAVNEEFSLCRTTP